MTRTLVLAAAAFFAIPAIALAQQTSLARSLAATCANCHGTNGRSVTSEVLPLAGLPRTFIVDRMREFRDGKRPATIMHQLARGYTDEQVELIAGYFAAQPAGGAR